MVDFSRSPRVRDLCAGDLDAADRLQRRAFAALVGADELRDTELVRTRWSAPHVRALGAFCAERLVGAVFVARWGSVGIVGPLAVDPERWDQGIGSGLIAAAEDVLDAWEVGHRGLFTFAHSPRHHRLYQRFGYWPRFLTALMAAPALEVPGAVWTVGSAVARPVLLSGAAALAGQVHPGLDVGGEIDAVLDQKLGDVLLLGPPDAPVGLAVLHAGAGSEAGSDVAYVKVGMVRPGAGADFARLVDACLTHAAQVGARRLVLGVSAARHRAYRHLLERGFATYTPGITMHKPNTPGYDHENAYVIDDWR